MSKIKILQGNNLELLSTFADNFFDSVVTDAPYGLGKEPNPQAVLSEWLNDKTHQPNGAGFMGEKWDAFVPQPLFWKEVYRVLKPGGFLLCFFGTRTYDWGTLAIRLGGFEIRDMISWHYGSGFPKSVDIDKSLKRKKNQAFSEQPFGINSRKTAGLGTALKPATEPICVARKPLAGTALGNILRYGTGGIHIDNCRIAFPSSLSSNLDQELHLKGRFPANVIFDEYTAELLDQQTGVLTSGTGCVTRRPDNGIFSRASSSEFECYGDSGGASRFFYCAKTSVQERNAGCDQLIKKRGGFKNVSGRGLNYNDPYKVMDVENDHPTVKPITLMRWLQRLVTPKGGTTLDPFAGSGTSGCSAPFEDLNIVLMEREIEYIPIIQARTKYWQQIANKEKQIRLLKASQLSLF